MEETSWVHYLSAIGSVATPLLVLVLTGVGWKYRQSFERAIKLEEKLRDDRIEIYNSILEPFILILMTDVAWQTDKRNKGKKKDELAITQMLSLEYRKTSFKLSLIGSDEVVKAFNNLFQYFYSQNDTAESEKSPSSSTKLLTLLGKFLLEIRKSMGNEATKLTHWDMLEWFITDARKIREQDA